MKKLLTSSIATIGILTMGISQYEADAAEQDTASNQATSGYENGAYYTIDSNGNFHHTLDGNWNQSMFDNKEYQSYEIDENGAYHYYYFTKGGQNYAPSQSHNSIENNGYNVEQSNVNNEASNNNETSNNNTTYQDTNVNENTNAEYKAPSNETVSSLEDTQSNTAQSEDTNQNSDQASSNWLSKNAKLQEYGQYHGGGAHYGIDYDMEENTPVYSLADGTVIQSGWSNYGGGNQVTIQEKDSDYYQWYMHMNKLNVEKGDEVKAGQQIGESGSTGNSTAPHLHFQRMKGGVGNEYAVNPESYVNGNQ
ncbi:M23 family metallopeptidase [Mammaliicoccus lentus]|uniref:M23 family metallopeptidase n=1 Tax=Mammaliicoccus lentus TaxID=42858 RepID=UPI0007D9C6D7|nr:M23 family metallopeptidase [Mammaliicoccus lentus]OAO24809.1 peptidase M23 [Mammaliicoccus lentus]